MDPYLEHPAHRDRSPTLWRTHRRRTARKSDRTRWLGLPRLPASRGQRGRYEVWAITLRQRLPRIRVPLADGELEVVLDLQAVFDRCYDEGAYARRLDYRREPLMPLSETDRAWADTLLRERGRQQ